MSTLLEREEFVVSGHPGGAMIAFLVTGHVRLGDSILGEGEIGILRKHGGGRAKVPILFGIFRNAFADSIFLRAAPTPLPPVVPQTVVPFDRTIVSTMNEDPMIQRSSPIGHRSSKLKCGECRRLKLRCKQIGVFTGE